jgi:uncharacterized protein YchJ
MKKYFLLLAVLFSLFIISCAGVAPEKKTMTEDLGSPGKETLLRSRVNEFWSAFMKEDYERIYALYDPFFRAKTEKKAFLSQVGKIKYHEFEIQDIKLEGNIATIKMKLVYSLPTIKMIQQEFSVPRSTSESTEHWLYIYDNWYKEYYVYSMEMSIANY